MHAVSSHRAVPSLSQPEGCIYPSSITCCYPPPQIRTSSNPCQQHHHLFNLALTSTITSQCLSRSCSSITPLANVRRLFPRIAGRGRGRVGLVSLLAGPTGFWKHPVRSLKKAQEYLEDTRGQRMSDDIKGLSD